MTTDLSKISPITFAVLTVESIDGREAAVKLIVQLLEELARVYERRNAQERSNP